jgi:dihydropyrimidine dehydrogenase (NAD+) subunit PreT
MLWLALGTFSAGLLAAGLAVRKQSRLELRLALEAQAEAHRRGPALGAVEQPKIDLAKCVGCGACVRACPEEGALALVHGQAALIAADRCVGHGACATACPTAAIEVGPGDPTGRSDLPALSPELEALGASGVFVAGEATTRALIQPATEQGRRVGEAIAARKRAGQLPRAPVDVLVVGAGPAGLAAALAAKAEGLSLLWIDRESEPGGTIARYPRRKLVLTKPLDLPLYGRLPAKAYTKEELVALWERIVREQDLPFQGQVEVQALARQPDGSLIAETNRGPLCAAAVCMAVGRRGTPTRLGVPGEDSPLVKYRLEDADSYRGRRILVVGGGDSAAEAALALSAHNAVTLSYRRLAFRRLKRTNETQLQAAVEAGRLHVELGSEVLGIDTVGAQLKRAGTQTSSHIACDDIFLMLGGQAPRALLERCLVPFDPSLLQRRPQVEPLPLERSLFLVCLATLATALFAYSQQSYYGLSLAERSGHDNHGWLRPGAGLGLGFGLLSLALIGMNLAYLWRRRRGPELQLWGRTLGTLKGWLSLHVATGFLALLAALLHSAFAPRLTVGGDAFWLLLGLALTGAIGRTVYARLPRAANGRELELLEARAELDTRLEALERGALDFGRLARRRFEELVATQHWGAAAQTPFLRAPLAWLKTRLSGRLQLRSTLVQLDREAKLAGLTPAQRAETGLLFARAARAAAAARDLEFWRGLLGLWRYLHRWGALLLVILLVAHVVYALRFGSSFEGARVPSGPGAGITAQP